jgi:hypothetical protein
MLAHEQSVPWQRIALRAYSREVRFAVSRDTARRDDRDPEPSGCRTTESAHLRPQDRAGRAHSDHDRRSGANALLNVTL